MIAVVQPSGGRESSADVAVRVGESISADDSRPRWLIRTTPPDSLEPERKPEERWSAESVADAADGPRVGEFGHFSLLQVRSRRGPLHPEDGIERPRLG